MNYRLSHFQSLTGEEIDSLQRYGIYTADDLVELGSTDSKRKEIAKACDLSGEKFNAIVSMADLLRVKGVGIRRATLLQQKYGFFTVIDLLKLGDEPDGIKELEAVLSVSVEKLHGILDNARKLGQGVSPKAIDEKEVTARFRQQLDKDLKTRHQVMRKYGRLLTLFLVIAVFVALLTQFYSLFNRVRQIDSFLFNEFGVEHSFFTNASLTLLLGLGIIATGVMIVYWIFQRYILEIPYLFSYKVIFPVVFKSSYHKVGYINYKMDEVQRSFGTMMWPTLISIGLIMLVYIVIAILPDVDDFIAALIIPTVIGLAVIFYVVFRRLWRSYALIKDTSYAAVKKRISLISSIDIALMLLLIFVSFYLLFKPVFYGTSRLAVLIQQNIRESQLEKMKISFEDADISEQTGNAYLATVDRLYHTIDDFDTNFENSLEMLNDPSIFNLLSMASIAIMVGLVFSFLIPYLRLNGLRNTSLFIIAILLGLVMNEVISRTSETFFFIEVGSWGYYVFLFAMSLLIMTYVDTIYDIFSKRVHCENCNYEITDKVNFCPNCGINIGTRNISSK